MFDFTCKDICPVTIDMVDAAWDEQAVSTKLYQQLVDHYRVFYPPITEYSELHHIIMRCMGGDDNLENLVRLPYVAHVLAHLLLASIHKGTSYEDAAMKALRNTLCQKDAAIAALRRTVICENTWRFIKVILHDKFLANRSELLRLAGCGASRPSHRTRLGVALDDYTSKNEKTYRPGLKEELVAAGADSWFRDTKYEKSREELLRLAQSGAPRPGKKTASGRALVNYVKSADHPELKAELVAAGAATWFIDTRWETDRKELLRLAQTGAPRPAQKTRLGKAMGRYTNSSKNGRPGFKEELVAAGAASWFEDVKFDIAEQELLRLARLGAPRPPKTTLLGRRLTKYLNSATTMYRFGLRAKLIAAGAAGWFRSGSTGDLIDYPISHPTHLN